MDRDFHKTLFFPFERSAIELPEKDEHALVIGARNIAALPSGWSAKTVWVQGFRPDFLALENAGADVRPEISGTDYDLALILCDRHRGHNETQINEAIARLKPGGLLIVAGGKTDGTDSLRKRCMKGLALEDSLSKFHGTVFWARRPVSPAPLFEPDPQTLIDGRFITAPGMFSAGRVDAGSRLLADYLPNNLKGNAADFAAGWGYLSAELLDKSPDLDKLDLYEADHASLQAARRNLSAIETRTQIGFHWTDLLREPVERIYDVIVMNPPFHNGRAAEPDIGIGLIAAASRALKPGGQLFMVANRNLPYEQVLDKAFRRHQEIANGDGFKVIKAVR